MIITDWNKMSVAELGLINVCYGIQFIIEDGRITMAEEGEKHE